MVGRRPDDGSQGDRATTSSAGRSTRPARSCGPPTATRRTGPGAALHQATFEEATLGSSGIGPLEWYFNKGPYAAPGAAGAVNNVYYRPSVAYPDPDDPYYVPAGIDHVFDVTNLPSYRLPIDMADLDGARIIQTTGQSGNPFDRHYGDLINAWLAGDTVPLPFSPTAVHEAMLQTLALVPKQ